MNLIIEQHKLELRQFNGLLRINPIFTTNQNKDKNEIPKILLNQMMIIGKTFGKFNVEIIKEADKPENGHAFKKNVVNSFFPIIKNYSDWYSQNSKIIMEKFGLENMYSATLNIMEMTQNSIVFYLNVNEPRPKEQLSFTFKELFRDKNCYKEVIKLLANNNFIEEIKIEDFNWKGCSTEKLSNVKLICVLALVLNKKNYLKTNLSDTYISIALTKSFKIKVSNTYFGQIKKEFIESSDKQKIRDYITSLSFIKTI